MAFFDDLSKTLSDKGKEAAQKAREAAGVLQMKAQIASEKSKLKELYGAVGVLYYKKHRDDEDTEFGDLFREIGNVLTNVAAMEEKVQQMEGAYVCPECRKVMKKDARFCSHCGAALRTEKETDEDETGTEFWEDDETAVAEHTAAMEEVAESEVVPETECFVTEEEEREA